MTNKNLKDIIDSRLENLRVNGELEEKILNSFSPPVKRRKWRPSAVAIVCLCLILSVPVIAATVSSFASLMAKVSPEVGEQLQPINLVCEDDGIKMEVVAAMNDNDTAFIYLNFQDLTGKRVDESISLYRYQVKCGEEYLSASPEMIAYDEVTNTATVRLNSRIIGAGIDNLDGKQLTVYVNSFLSNKQDFGDFDTGINLKEIDDRVTTVKLDISGKNKGSSSDALLAELEKEKNIDILKPDGLSIPLPGIDFAYISNIGVVDGRLHVQLRRDRGTTAMNISGYIALIANSPEVVKDNEYFTVDWDDYVHLPRVEINFNTDENGKIINDSMFTEDYEEGEIYPDYVEIIFGASTDILSECKLMGLYFSAYRNYNDCNLQTTFEVAALNESKSLECDIDLGGIKLSNVSVSPLGVVASGMEDESYEVRMNVSLTMTDGSVAEFGESIIGKTIDSDGNGERSYSSLSDNPDITTSTNSGANGEFSVKYTCKIPLDIDNIASITINGTTVNLTR